MSSLVFPFARPENMSYHAGLLAKVVPPALSAAKHVTALNLRMCKDVALTVGQAWEAAALRADLQPLSRLVEQFGDMRSPLKTEYATALAQILAGAGTQMMINASWLTSEPKTPASTFSDQAQGWPDTAPFQGVTSQQHAPAN